MGSESSVYSPRRNYSWAVFLILVGGLLLLNSIGIVSWGIWMYIVRFWPILVVLIGIRIILGNSGFGRIVGMILTIVLTVSVFVVAYIQYTKQGIEFLPKKINDWVLQGGGGVFNLNKELVENTFVISPSQYPNAKERVLRVDVGACNLVIDQKESEEILKISSKYPEGFNEPLFSHSESLGVLEIDFTGAKADNFLLFYDNSEYNLSIGKKELITDLDVKLGAGDGNLNLEDLLIKDLWAEVGAGKLDITLGVESVPSGETKITVGAGKMNFKVPTRVGYTLEYDLGVGNITVDGKSISEISGGRGRYVSPNFDTSDISLTIYVTVGVGSFNIENS